MLSQYVIKREVFKLFLTKMKMLNHIKIFLVLIILVLNIGCSGQKYTSLSDCDLVKNEQKRDKCFAMLIEDIPSDNVNQRFEICGRIVNTELRDLCFFKTVKDVGISSPPIFPPGSCEMISNRFLQDSCYLTQARSHLQIVVE